MIFDEIVKQDCWSRLVGKGLNVGGAEFGGDAVVGEEKGQSVASAYIPEASGVYVRTS